MPALTLDDLVLALRECAGVDESVDLDGDILDVALKNLGYDSLALFNTICRIEREQGIELPDEFMDVALTPRQLLDGINAEASTSCAG